MSEDKKAPERIYFTPSYFDRLLIRNIPSATSDVGYVRADVAERYRAALVYAKNRIQVVIVNGDGGTVEMDLMESINEALHPTQPVESNQNRCPYCFCSDRANGQPVHFPSCDRDSRRE